jgi:hypothetical protein
MRDVAAKKIPASALAAGEKSDWQLVLTKFPE